MNGDLIIFTFHTWMKYTSGNDIIVYLMTQKRHTPYLRCQRTQITPYLIQKKSWKEYFENLNRWNAFSFPLGVLCQSATSAAQREAFKELFLQSTFLSVKEKEKREILFLTVSLLFAGVPLLYIFQLKKMLLWIALLWQSGKSNMLRFYKADWFCPVRVVFKVGLTFVVLQGGLILQWVVLQGGLILRGL